MSVIERSAAVAREEPEPLSRALSSPWLGAALVLVAIAQQLLGHIDCDVSWFLTFAEKVLDGHAAYVEASDPNPPAAFLSLMPAVLLARALHMEPETVVAALVFAFAAGSINFSFYLLRHGAARTRRAWMLLLNAALFLLLVAPEIVFAEREHIALLAVLPLLAALAVEERRAPPRWARIVAGLGAGVAVALKPHFVLAIALPALAIAWREHSLRILWRDELVVAGLAAVGATIATLVAFPAYLTQALPLALEVYGPARDDLGHFLGHTLALVYVALLAGFLVAARGVVLGRATLVALLSSLGFFAAFLLQGKGWMNHAFPAVALLLFAWIFLALRDRIARVAPPTGTKRALIKFLFLPGLVAAPAYFGVVEQVTDHEEHPGLLDAVAFVAPPHPRVATIASQLDYGHPLVRQLDGEWVGRQNALWATAAVGRLLATAAPPERDRLEARRSADLAGLAQDIREGRPDIIVVEDRATRDWVLRRPEMAGALDAYRLAKQAGDIEIWRRAE